MARPALRRLLEDVQAGRVQIVVVYKVDRLTRSLADFAKIVDVLDANQASFVSVTQQFNTTTSMGRLTLNVLLSFAQLEREIAGERIRDKIAASKRKGIWMGGNVPLGYDARDRKLVVNDREAETVRLIFQRYVALGSVRELKEGLDRLGVVSKRREGAEGILAGGKPLSRGALYTLLQNRLYRGQIVHQGDAFAGQHASIVDVGLWQAVQDQLASNRCDRRLAVRAQEPSLLAGLIVDAKGDRMTPSHGVRRGKRYRYYVSSHLLGTQQNHCSDGQRVPAGDVEGAVLNRLKEFYASPIDVSEALLSFRMTANDQERALQRATELTQNWLARSTADHRVLVQLIVSQVMIKSDQIVVALDRSAVPRSLLGQHLDELKCSEADDNCGSLLLTIGTCLRRSGKGVRLVIRTGAEARPDPTISRLFGEAFSLRDRLLAGCDESIEALSNRLSLGRGYVTSRVRLTYLSPVLVRSILNGEAPLGLTARKLLGLTKDLPLDWTEQPAHLGFSRPPPT